MGTAEFAVPPLEGIAASRHDVATVVTQPDRPGGRGQRLRPSPVGKAASLLGFGVAQPDSLNAAPFRQLIEDQKPDIVAVVAYAKRIPAWLIAWPPHGVVNLHGSLLPKYRGAAPVNWAIARGESRTGVCTMQIDEGLDTGPVYACRETDIGAGETAPDLLGRLARMGAELLLETLASIESGEARPHPQSDRGASLAPRLTREDGYIGWEEPALEIHNRIRAFLPWPAVVVAFRGQTCRLLESRVGDIAGDGPQQGTLPGMLPGMVTVKGGRLAVRCGDGRLLEILKVQPENRRPLSAREFVNGFRPKTGDRFASLLRRAGGAEQGA